MRNEAAGNANFCESSIVVGSPNFILTAAVALAAALWNGEKIQIVDDWLLVHCVQLGLLVGPHSSRRLLSRLGWSVGLVSVMLLRLLPLKGGPDRLLVEDGPVLNAHLTWVTQCKMLSDGPRLGDYFVAKK